MTDQNFFENISFHIRHSGNPECVELCSVLEADTEKDRTLIASVLVDDMEMIESARIPLTAGKRYSEFCQTIRIIRPALWYPGSMGEQSVYNFKILFYQAGKICHTFEKQYAFSFVKKENRCLKINGKTIQNLSALSVIRLSDDEPELESKISLNSRKGNFIILKLNGHHEPENFICAPGVCLFTAEPDSPGAEIYNKTHGVYLPPLYSSAEIDELLQKG